MLAMSPTRAVPARRSSATAAETAGAGSAAASRACPAMTARAQSGIEAARGTAPRRPESSRCVCALTRPGSTTWDGRRTQRAPPARGADDGGPTPVTMPPATSTQPSRIGGLATGRIQAA